MQQNQGILRPQRDKKIFNFFGELNCKNETYCIPTDGPQASLWFFISLYEDWLWGNGILKQTLSGSVMSTDSHGFTRAPLSPSASPPGHQLVLSVSPQTRNPSLTSLQLHHHQAQASAFITCLGSYNDLWTCFPTFIALSNPFSLNWSSQPGDWTWVSCIAGRFFTNWTTSSVQFGHSIMSNSLWPHGLKYARPLCPTTTPRVYSNSCPLSWWYHPTISSSSPLAFNLSQHQGLFQWVSSSHQVAKVLEFQL